MAKIPGMSAASSAKLPTTWSEQQQAVFDWIQQDTGNATAEAVAGSGKTTTLLRAAEIAKTQVGFCAYNKKIAEEIGSKLTALGITNAKSQTLHAVGMKALGKLLGRLEVAADKTDGVLEELDAPFYYRAAIKKLLSLGKQSTLNTDSRDSWVELMDHYDVYELMPEQKFKPRKDPTEEVIEWTLKALYESRAQAKEGLIDFDDMIYESLLLEAPFPAYDWVLLDEAQDTNNARREIATRMMSDNSRFIAVGDRHQAIYGFTGANSDALDLISQQFQCKHLPLTVTYRCPKAVVAHARQWVSHIEAHPSAPEGAVEFITATDFFKQKPAPSDAILCRNNKPLVSLAFGFIRNKVACHIEGRDIGQGLITLIKKWKTASTIGELHSKLMDYKESQCERLRSRGNHSKAASIADKVDTIFVLMEGFSQKDNTFGLIALINSLFLDSEGKQLQSITLSTVHKAKGREWNRVYLWGRDHYMPSPYAKQDWELEQERNLIYVAVTRAKQELVEVSVGGEE